MFCRYIKNKTGWAVTISNIGFSFTGIILKSVNISQAALHLKIDRLNLGLNLSQSRLIIKIEHLETYYQPTASTNTISSNTSKQNAFSSLQKVLGQLSRLWQRKHPKLSKYTRISIQHFQFFYLQATQPVLAITQLRWAKQQITFQLQRFGRLQSIYGVNIRFDRYRILFALHNLSSQPLDILQINRLKGKIDFAHAQQLSLSVYGANLNLNHPKIGEQTINLEKINCLFKFDRFEDRLELNPDSFFQFNDSYLQLKGHFNHEEGLCALVLYFNVEVEQLIGLIPHLQNQSLRDFKSEGQIGVGLSLGFLWDDPLHYKFDLAYDTEDFKVINPGIDLSYLLKDFGFKSLINPENHRLLTITGSNNLTQHLLAKIIQLAEDPNFYQHNGVDSYFVGVAIANNLAQKKFFKGASTLSMQLVKNLFLGQQKTLTRKLEELILTMLMENHFHIPKERILAIYLQLIELGPNIYGIEEAAKFYFNKSVAALSPLECLVISYIIPRPRFFLDAVLQKSEQLDRNLSKHISSQLGRLVAQRIFNAAELLSMSTIIQFHQHGQFELSHLNLQGLAQSLTRQEAYFKNRTNENSSS